MGPSLRLESATLAAVTVGAKYGFCRSSCHVISPGAAKSGEVTPVRLLATVLTVLLLSGCAAKPVRVGQGECAIFKEDGRYVVIGKDCRIETKYR